MKVWKFLDTYLLCISNGNHVGHWMAIEWTMVHSYRGWLWPFTMFYSDARYGAFWLKKQNLEPDDFRHTNQMYCCNLLIGFSWSWCSPCTLKECRRRNSNFCKLSSWLFRCIQSMPQNCLHKMSSIISSSLTKLLLFMPFWMTTFYINRKSKQCFFANSIVCSLLFRWR